MAIPELPEVECRHGIADAEFAALQFERLIIDEHGARTVVRVVRRISGWLFHGR
jgi:hypothetical protein